jgi:hypothetical protein
MNSRHVCPGCRQFEVDQSRLACRTCWYGLPIQIRSLLLTSWRNRVRNPHDLAVVRTHRAVVVAAIKILREQHYNDTPDPIERQP